MPPVSRTVVKPECRVWRQFSNMSAASSATEICLLRLWPMSLDMPRCTWASIRPGVITSPVQSSTSAPAGGASPSEAIRPSSTRMFWFGTGSAPVPSMTVAPVSHMSVVLSSMDQRIRQPCPPSAGQATADRQPWRHG